MRFIRITSARFPFSNFRFPFTAFLFSLFYFLISSPVNAQSLREDLREFTAHPAITGYEQWLATEIKSRLAKWKPRQDNMGNVWITLGSGAPHRLIVAPMDEPGYIVSGITEDGFLRVQRLPQAAPHALFDQLHAAQPVVIHTRKGKWVYGVVAGLSTHLQGARRDAPRVNHPDEIYVDIGASSVADVRKAGVDFLDPIGLDRTLYEMSYGQFTAPGIGDRFGAAALLELTRRLDAAKVRGTLTIAFVAQQWASSRGMDRLLQQIKADELIYVGRLLPRRAGPGSAQGPGRAGAQGASQQPVRDRKQPGGGAILSSDSPVAQLTDFPDEIAKLAAENKIPLETEAAATLPRVSYTRGPELPARFVHLGIATAWANTPAEFIHSDDLDALAGLLDAYAQGAAYEPKKVGIGGGIGNGGMRKRPTAPPTVTEILEKLVETYGMSGYENNVNEAVANLLPEWAKTETDADGNLWMRFPVAPTVRKAPKIVFVAHMDEIGYRVQRIAPDGRLEVQSRGGGIIEFFAGHAILVHTASSIRPGVMELPTGWDQPNFEWPRGPQASPLRVDVGARSPAEVGRLGIKVGDQADWITVPKKYRPLYGQRANGRSFDDRVGCTALVAAAWALGKTTNGKQSAPRLPAEIIFVWATREEVGLEGAKGFADRMKEKGEVADFVFAVDTFVSSDSPLESKRFADTPIGKGFVIRAVDNSNITDRKYVDKLIALARANNIPVQYGVTGGGNDGAVFLRHGTVDIPISWPLRYSHSPGEVIDMRDVDALARIIAAIARGW